MKSANPKNCPDQTTLLQYLQGLLEPPKLGHCEEHVTDCQSCHETLRGLDFNDTLSHHVSDAIKKTPDGGNSDSQAIDGLIQRLLKPENLNQKLTRNRNASTEIMADKAAEVLRCIEPPSDADGECLGTLGNYRLLKLIGAGGTGVVFQAKDLSLDRVVALKVLRPSLGEIARERFIAEARLAASIEHDNVVAIYQIGKQDRLAFIAMQWTPGETLEARLECEPGLLHEDTVREFVLQIASGLAAAHQRQLIHRDIKPANIWICDDTGRIKILDFGLARVADEESSLTQTGMLAGTPSFMSPEQTKGMELDPRSDLFSLGCVMYRLLTGRLPFSASTVLGTLQTIQSDCPRPPADLDANCSEDLSDLTMSLLEKLPGNRLASAESLIACLKADRDRWPLMVPRTSTGKVSVEAKEQLPQTATAKTKSSGTPVYRGPGNWITAITLLGLLAVPGWLFAPQIYRIATNQGELVVETFDENVKVQVLRNGEVVKVLDETTGNSLEIEAGEYTFAATNDDESEFKISPESIEISRGGREIVSVAMVSKKQRANVTSQDQAIDSTPDPSHFLSDMMAAKNRIDSTYGDRQTPEKRKAQMAAAIEALEVQKSLSAGRVGSGHPVTQAFDTQITAMKNQFKALDEAPAPPAIPIYRGRTFQQWLSIANTDREPQTIADAVAACGSLADGERKKQFVELLQRLVRRYGAANAETLFNGGDQTPTNILFTGFIKGLEQLDTQDVAQFVQNEIEQGNEQSLGFCARVYQMLGFNGGQFSKSQEFRNSLKLDMNPLLKRMENGEIKNTLDLRSFLEVYFNSKASADLASCKSLISKLDIPDRPAIYRIFMSKFENGEFDELIEADFFSKETDAQTRENFISSLKTSYGMYGGMGGGGGFASSPSSSPNAISLLHRLLIQSIERAVDPGLAEVEFASFRSNRWFNEKGPIEIVQVSRVGHTRQVTWTDSNGQLTTKKPDGARQIQGTAAIVRSLLTEICQLVRNYDVAEHDEETLLAFVDRARRSTAKELFETKDFKDLRIGQDLAALLDRFNGSSKEGGNFSAFVFGPQQQSSFGQTGNGGVF